MQRDMAKVSESVYISLFEGLSLTEYITVRKAYWSCNHKSPCTLREKLLLVASTVVKEGYVSLPQAFSIVSPNVRYTAEKARKKLLQMPLVAVCVGDPCKGKSFTLLLEHYSRVNYSKMSLVINGLISTCATHNPQGLEKDCVKMLLGLVLSDRERGCIRYAIFKASGMSATQARHQYRFERMTEHLQLVEEKPSKDEQGI